MDLKAVIEDYQDYLAPTLDMYEATLYLYILRHSRLQGLTEITIGFKSARRRMPFGRGQKGRPMSEATCYRNLRSLAAKGCVEILDSERTGTRVRLALPSEIQGLVPASALSPLPVLEDMDFFADATNRAAILKREGGKCFYCLRELSADNFVAEHIISRPAGDNSYRNVVAACRACNNRKGEDDAASFLRTLYRNGTLDQAELSARLEALALVQRGGAKPVRR